MKYTLSFVKKKWNPVEKLTESLEAEWCTNERDINLFVLQLIRLLVVFHGSKKNAWDRFKH